jgi:SAM-dependent methyltransferase
MHTTTQHERADRTAESDPTAQAFSRYAPDYDREQQANLLARWTRARSKHILARSFRPGDRVLEIGCGTGEEALYLASRGVNVMATDAASGMVEVVRAKLAALDAGDPRASRVGTQVLAARDIGQLVDEFGRASFAGAYSSFGPLNCEADLRPVASALAELVRPGGKVVISLLNRFCAWETVWHLAKLQPRTAFRRWGGHAQATVRGAWGDQRIPVYYLTPGTIEGLFLPHFATIRRTALTWALPPPYLEGVVKYRLRLLRLLANIEVSFASRWPFNAIGDHVVLEMVRRRH